jgi:hypothetical protein
MASVPYNFAIDRAYAFAPDPNTPKRVGYITKLKMLGLTGPAAPDLIVSVPFSGQPAYPGIALRQPASANPSRTSNVVGVLENLEWNGGVGDPLRMDFWISQANATAIKAAQQSTLATTKVDTLAWWVADYDQEVKKWFEQSFPITGAEIAGLIGPEENPQLNVDTNPVLATGGIDANVYRVTISVVPNANMPYELHFANSSTNSAVKQWGIVVGTLAPGAVPPTQT